MPASRFKVSVFSPGAKVRREQRRDAPVRETHRRTFRSPICQRSLSVIGTFPPRSTRVGALSPMRSRQSGVRASLDATIVRPSVVRASPTKWRTVRSQRHGSAGMLASPSGPPAAGGTALAFPISSRTPAVSSKNVTVEPFGAIMATST